MVYRISAPSPEGEGGVDEVHQVRPRPAGREVCCGRVGGGACALGRPGGSGSRLVGAGEARAGAVRGAGLLSSASGALDGALCVGLPRPS